MKHSRIDILVIGMALFSMFFGAGNIIFPPYLGMQSGVNWILGFLSYYAADIGLAVLAIFAVLRCKGDTKVLMDHLGPKSGTLMLSLIILCIGPLIAVPRTGATTYEMFVVPVFGDIPSWIAVFIFFGIIFLLTIRRSSVVDILGKFLTPALFAGLLILIIKGILTPIGDITNASAISDTVSNGILAGYQTMDVLAAVVFGMIIVETVRQKGYTSEKEQYLISVKASLLACAGLLIVYGGLTFLGAAIPIFRGIHLSRTELILFITRSLLGKFGIILLGVVVALACITTAAALISASSDYFSNLTGGKLRYEWLVGFLCVFSALLATAGTDAIVSIAAPILNILYPGMLALLFLSFFSEKMGNDYVIRGAVGGALLASLLDFLASLGLPFAFIRLLPLSSFGFGWLLPAVVGGVVGVLLGKKMNAE